MGRTVNISRATYVRFTAVYIICMYICIHASFTTTITKQWPGHLVIQGNCGNIMAVNIKTKVYKTWLNTKMLLLLFIF